MRISPTRMTVKPLPPIKTSGPRFSAFSRALSDPPRFVLLCDLMEYYRRQWDEQNSEFDSVKLIYSDIQRLTASLTMSTFRDFKGGQFKTGDLKSPTRLVKKLEPFYDISSETFEALYKRIHRYFSQFDDTQAKNEARTLYGLLKNDPGFYYDFILEAPIEQELTDRGQQQQMSEKNPASTSSVRVRHGHDDDDDEELNWIAAEIEVLLNPEVPSILLIRDLFGLYGVED
jgi:hypothetical protein